MKAKRKQTISESEGVLEGMLKKEKEQLKTLEAKMASYLKDNGEMPTDDEIRELCHLRSRQKEQK